ncbi:probable carboxylesterase 2 [Impatiens glandulifera]|uniref:probable carboxylesterase 2 n=1 Tax=Impatiens glandulifera TaxID=253017 RepID=UPI001FB13CEF|nr:probable carboxylesterase 2 [Impatiens glandulifera]
MTTTYNNLLCFSLFLILFSGGGITTASSRKTCKPAFYQFFIKVYSNCTIEKLVKYDPIPPSLDNETQVQSSDLILHLKSNLTGRLYRPSNITAGQRVPILIYFHGGGFMTGSPFNRNAQSQLFRISSIGKIVVLSVDYVLAPEHKIPIPYRSGDKALKWLAMHAAGKADDNEKWVDDVVDFNRVFIGGQSSGGNIAYNVAMRLQQNKRKGIEFAGLILMDPYILTADPSPALERIPENFRRNITGLWTYVCPKSTGVNDTRVNPSLETKLGVLKPGKVLFCVGERDPLIDGSISFYNVLLKNNIKTEFYKTMGRGHAFDNMFPDIAESFEMYQKIDSFIRSA